MDRVVPRAEFNSLGDFERRVGGPRCRDIFENFYAIALEGRKQIVDLFRGVFLSGKKIVHFFIKHVAPAFAEVD